MAPEPHSLPSHPSLFLLSRQKGYSHSHPRIPVGAARDSQEFLWERKKAALLPPSLFFSHSCAALVCGNWLLPGAPRHSDFRGQIP